MSRTIRERFIICGPKPVKHLGKGKPDLKLSLTDNVHLKIRDISKRLAANIPSLFIDLLEIATYVYCADQASTRGGNGVQDEGARWRRRLRFYIPVRNPAFWKSSGVLANLQETLSFLSDDQYEFVFSKLFSVPDNELYFDFGSGPGTDLEVKEVMMFSGGIDSLSGAVQALMKDKRSAALVSHRSAPKVDPIQRFLAKALQQRCPTGVSAFHIPVWINKDSVLSREFTQRSRSFLYASLGAIVASIFKLDTIRFYENGIVSFNLPISAQVIGGKATRVTHPKVLAGYSKLFSQMNEKDFKVENPFQWETKAEVLGRLKDANFQDLIKYTVSCNSVFERTRAHTHCGVCSQCVDRRFGVMASGLKDHDPVSMYGIDFFKGEIPTGVSRTMVESIVRTAQEVSKMTDYEFFARFPEVFRILPHTGLSTDKAAEKLYALHKRHALEILDVTDSKVKESSRKLTEGSLSESCLVSLMIPEKYKKNEPTEQSAYKFIKIGDYWKISYGGKPTFIKDSKGLRFISYLLAHPGKGIPILKLVAAVDGQLPPPGDGEFVEMSGEEFEKEGLSMAQQDSEDKLVDEQTVTEAKRELAKLKAKLVDYETSGDFKRASETGANIKAIEKYLSGSVGLGGRIRRTSSSAEKARIAVTKSIIVARRKLQHNLQPLAEHLKSYLQTGLICIYNPPSESRIDWNL